MKAKATAPLVGILMGSDSDWEVMSGAATRLDALGVSYEIMVTSAHRAPQRTAAYASSARERGLRVVIAGAGVAAHLAGVIAAHTTLPVIGVPLESGSLRGLDALLATVQMPPGVPVATVAIGKAGAENAAILAAQILALGDARLAARLATFKKELARQVEEKDARLQQQRRRG
ncbi:MAG TPA: 5-(carboxyamino)imidazole ribonucleotide mutase [Candidatus Acidoferrales bacterium]|nr:5-(carboxyamino)imidazole ribonucleotide mutase [Candidatus Acidoferrales bacterium]